MISFGQQFTEWFPSIFPYSNYALVAPFWDDTDLSSTGAVYYEVITRDNGLSVIDQVDTYISNNQSISFSADWILVVKWLNVCPDGDHFCSSTQVKYFAFFLIVFSYQPNTFQAVIASDGSLSYAVFTYQCNLIKWTLYNAAVGYTDGLNFFQNHPLSRTSDVVNIDCVNQPASNWSNVAYKISLCSPPCVNGRFVNCHTG